MEKLLTYALKDNFLVHISEVENGLKCNCFCPKCNSALVAKNAGKKKVAHFSHHSNMDCQGYYESAIHLLVKDIILKHKKLLLPSKMESVLMQEYEIEEFDELNEFFELYEFRNIKKHKKIIKKFYQLVHFDEVQLEKRINIDDSFIVPDIIAKKDGKEILIEVVFSHDVDEGKMEKIRKLGIPCLRIFVFHLELNINMIKKDLFEYAGLKTWLFNPKLESKTKQYVDDLRQKNRTRIKKLEEEKKLQLKRELERELYLVDNFVMFPMKYQYSNCKLIIEETKEKFKTTSFSKIPFLNDIVNSNKWNGKIYGGVYSKYIYFNNSRIDLFDETIDDSLNKFRQ